MKKKVDVKNIKPGMYIATLDRPWLETPFLFHSFFVKTEKQILKLKQYCHYVYIDTEKGDDVETGSQKSLPDTETEIPICDDADMETQEEDYEHTFLSVKHIEREIQEAAHTREKAKEVIHGALDDIKMGKSVDSLEIKNMVEGLGESVLKNSNALLCLSNLRNKDEYTICHSVNVCVLALSFGRFLGFSEDDLKTLGLGAILHDMGKMKVPDSILNKPGSLTEEEFEVMRHHVAFGVEIVQDISVPPDAMEVVLNHHERYSGKGYLQGLKGDEAGIFGMIASIVDVYDAITSDRVYRNAISPNDALRMMYEWRETDFKGILVEKFIRCLGIYPAGSLIQLDTGEIGVVLSVNPKNVLKPAILLTLGVDLSPYTPPVVIDLLDEEGGSSPPKKIKRSLEAGTFGIDPKKVIEKFFLQKNFSVPVV